jgi:hypothetical protein
MAINEQTHIKHLQNKHEEQATTTHSNKTIKGNIKLKRQVGSPHRIKVNIPYN